MVPITPIQTATGGSPLVVALVLLGMFLTTVLSLLVAYVMVTGYREHRNRTHLAMAVGVIMLTAGPILIQLVLTNAMDVSQLGRSLAANASKLVGLAAMLYSIYGVTRTRTVRIERDGTAKEVKER